METKEKLPVDLYRNGGLSPGHDAVVTETRLTIHIGSREIASLFCSPSDLIELAVGYAAAEDLLPATWCLDDIVRTDGDDGVDVVIPAEGPPAPAGRGTMTSGCARGITYADYNAPPRVGSGAAFSPEDLVTVYRRFQQHSKLFRATGGVHSAALTDGTSLLTFSEDIGRHNAVDKIVGSALLNRVELKGRVILVSGRLSSEIVFKGLRAGVACICSRSAPTSLAVRLAREGNVTLVGFLRGNRFNVYSHRDRLASEKQDVRSEK